MSIIDTLVTDRSLADVQLWQALKDMGWGAMTSEQQLLWSSGSMKGAYNASDLNRVIGAVNYLAGVFQSYGYAPGVIQQTANWPVGQVPTQSQMQVYLGNVQALMDALAEVQFSAELPQSMALLSYAGANSIEAILTELDSFLQEMAKVWVKCDQMLLFCGNVFYLIDGPQGLLDSLGFAVLTKDGKGVNLTLK